MPETKKMIRKLNNHRYSKFSTIDEILTEKKRLRKRIKRQEKNLSDDWRRIEDGWRIVNKIVGMAGSLFSSASMLGSFDLGYKLLSHFFSRKKKRKAAKFE